MSDALKPLISKAADMPLSRAEAEDAFEILFEGAATPAQLGKGNGVKVQMSRWKGMDEDISDDQQDIARGRNMVDSKFQGGFGLGGTHVSSFPIARVPPPRTFNRRRGRASALPAPARTAHKLRVSPSKTLWGFTQKSLPTQRSRAVVESN